MTTTHKQTASFIPQEQAIGRRLGDKTIILHLDHGIYFELDPMGTFIWEQLQAGETAEAICASVRVSFDTVPEAVEEDIAEFLGQLLENGLIERS